jgi:hypothetical protein
MPRYYVKISGSIWNMKASVLRLTLEKVVE